MSRLLSLLVLGVVAVLLAGCGGSSPAAEPAGEPAVPTVRTTPDNGAQDVSPTGEITASVTDGTITEATMTNESGEQVKGAVAPDRTSWAVGEPLGYGKTYTLSVTAQGQGGEPVTHQSTFTTVSPKNQTYVSMNPLDGQTVGVGQPLAFYFSADAPAPDKERAEQAIEIKTEPAVEGAFYWYDDREVHWRPKEYWEPGTKIELDINVYGKDLGNGVWGRRTARPPSPSATRWCCTPTAPASRCG
ncbi:Ig-like domain-containing protein [Saccharopolyspora sp. CA-218241]|uniref:Ig-like domain-containing protein n=1 Tax=Saccharopolyspora sp. CA-218241 TaxID=3240027 RepID=UPI003D9526E0